MQALARPAFRAANTGTLRRFPRAGIRYQSTAQPKDRTNSTLIYSGIATLAVVGGYFYVRQSSHGITNDTQAGKEPEKAFAGGEQGFLSLKLDSTEDINHNTKKFIFQLPKSDMIAGLPVASALSTQYKTEEMEKAVSKPYTPTSAEDERGYLELVVKRYENGPMSSHIHSLKPGETLDIKGPIVKYDYKANMHNHIAMIAGGSGITPMYQVARRILSDPDDKTKVTLVFGNVTKDDILLKKEFDKFENTYPNRFRVFYVLDNPPEDWQGGKGFITRDLLKTVLPEPKEENIKIFVCGPPGLYKAVSGTKAGMKDQGELTGALKELGYSKDQVFKF